MGKLLQYKVRRLFNDRPNLRFVPKPGTKVINWGNRVWRFPEQVPLMINNLNAVAAASNKLVTFQVLKDIDGIRIPNFTTDRSVADQWVQNGIVVVCRTKLSGHSGDGIVLSSDAGLVNAPLYVQYVKKQKEFRVHVAFGEVIDVQEKRKRDGFEGADFQVRNHQTGWVYCRENITEPEGMRGMATLTVASLGLDFGAVDIIWNEKRNECYVLECNTAPGLEGLTVDKYAEAFVRHLRPDEDYESTTNFGIRS